MENYSVNDLISWRIIDGQILILDSHLNESAHELNEVASFIFSSISEGETITNITQELKESYPEEPTLEEDIKGFLKKLSDLKLIVPAT